MQLDYFAGDYENAGSGIQAMPVITADYSGNIQTQSWINNGELGAYQYEYDDQYQLSKASWKTPNFATAMLEEGNSLYDVTVSYTNPATNKLDGNGNIHRLARNEPVVVNNDITGFQTKAYDYFYERPEQPNTLTRVDGYAEYTYNAIGQMRTADYVEVPNEASRDMQLVYDVSGKVREVRSLATNELQAEYAYDDKGYRVKTEVDGKATYYVRDAGGSIMSVYVKEVNGSIQPKEYPIYGSGRIGVAHKTGENYAYLYELKDHLGNVRATVQDIADPVDMYADFYPFGLRQPQRFGKGTFGSRFQYQGEHAEFDEETEFNFFEARMWDPIIGRWFAVDPSRQFASPYLGMGNNPVNGIDPDGRDWFKDQNGNTKWFDNSSGGFSDLDGNSWEWYASETLEFNGTDLTFNYQTGNELEGTLARQSISFPAVSGRPLENGTFDYSLSRQGIENVGPLPAGVYQVDPDGFQHLDVVNEVLGYLNFVGIKAGRFPGGVYAWGVVRNDIHGFSAIRPKGGFTIHGGLDPGSAGCIDLCNGAYPFYLSVSKYSRGNSIPLHVDYGHINAPVQSPFR